jgi:peptidoglycan/xylan/chitin deacetylase (PgdA/CDA1 family)
MVSLKSHDILRLIGHNGPVIFSYHGIGPLHSFERLCNNETPMSIFETQIEEIERHMQIVQLDDLLRRIQKGLATDLMAAITFDDGWKSTFRNGLPFLQKKRIPSTIFINPAFVDNKQWPFYLIAAWLYDRGFADNLRKCLRDTFQADYNLTSGCEFHCLLQWIICRPAEDRRMAKALEEVMKEISADPSELAQEYGLFCELTDLRRANDYCSYGTHGYEHINYGVSSIEARRSDLLTAKAWFERKQIKTVGCFALPFGLMKHLGGATVDLSVDCGYSSIMLLEGHPCLARYRRHSPVLDRLLARTCWDQKDIYLACRGVKVISSDQ